MMTAVNDAITDGDSDEFTRTCARPGGWRGPEGLCQSIVTGNGQTRALAGSQPLAVPVLTVDGVSVPLTERTFRQAAAGKATSVRLEEAGHLVAQEAPGALCAATPEFTEHAGNG